MKDDNRERLRIRPWMRQKVYERDSKRCVFCGSKESVTVDHIVPCSRGGTNDFDNLVTCCFACNLAKSDYTPSEIGWSVNPWFKLDDTPENPEHNDRQWRKHMIRRKRVPGTPGEWVPCSDGVPEGYGDYIVTFADGTIDILYYTNSYVWVDVDENWRDGDVVAWSPLPLPYAQDKAVTP